mgnify:CR=1 FL=1
MKNATALSLIAVKRAIVDNLLRAYRVTKLPETGAKFQVDVALHGDVARLTLDLCGDALNRRGYRTWNGEAPLRETLAAALALMSPWVLGQWKDGARNWIQFGSDEGFSFTLQPSEFMKPALTVVLAAGFSNRPRFVKCLPPIAFAADAPVKSPIVVFKAPHSVAAC